LSLELVAVAVAAPLHKTFDYFLPTHLSEASAAGLRPGMRVRVPFGRRSVVGVVLQPPRFEAAPPRAYRPVTEILDQKPLLPAELLTLLRWCAGYYQHPVGEVIAAALPGPLRRAQALRPVRRAPPAEASELPPALTGEQSAALQAARAAQDFDVLLLQGVTGSGKTEIYLQRIADVLASGRQALLLAPEIGLTPQLLQRLCARFGAGVAAYHSGLSEAARARLWLQARDGEVQVVVGTRSAVLLPFRQLGLIVVDEEHDTSYKQQEGFRYSARDVAILRAQKARIPVILGSATPSLESLHNAASGRYRLARLQARVRAAAPPQVRLLDVRAQPLAHGLSKPLLDAVEQHVDSGGQALLFINRRGFAPLLLCHDCGWIAPCPDCDARLTVHRARGLLICHHCGAQQPLTRSCPSCDSRQLVPVGQGTERIEEALRNRFPARRVERFDSDRLRKAGELARLLADIRSGAIHILVGTQVLAKGHDFDGLSLVGIVSADQALYGSDFRAIERMGQLVTQVAGRAGRSGRAGEVLLQTHEPLHPLLQTLVREGYDALCAALLAERQAFGLPPFAQLALLRAEARQPAAALGFLNHARAALGAPGSLRVSEPIPALMERRAGYHRAQLLIQCDSRAALQRRLAAWAPLLDELPAARSVRWSLDVDPYDLF
jgi:primosomal protein N' (replication factor Y) (superfamily II helicase)